MEQALKSFDNILNFFSIETTNHLLEIVSRQISNSIILEFPPAHFCEKHEWSNQFSYPKVLFSCGFSIL